VLRSAIAVLIGRSVNSLTSQPKASSDSRIVSSGLVSSHSPGRFAWGAGVGAGFAMRSGAPRAASSVGAVHQAMATDTAISTPVSTSDCHRKIVWENGITPVIASKAGGMLAGFACSCAADELNPIAHTAPRPR